MLVFATETSCDETSICLMNNNSIVEHITFSQEIHKIHGGVVPELASRSHLEKIQIITNDLFNNKNIEPKKIDVFTLNKEFGRKNGTYIYNAIRGINDEPVKEKEESIQYSKIITLKKDSKEYEYLLENLYELCKQIHDLIKNNNKMFKSIGIHFVQSDLSNKSKSKMLRNSTNNLEELEKNIEQLLTDALEDQSMTIRRIGVRVSDLSEIKGQSDITNFF